MGLFFFVLLAGAEDPFVLFRAGKIEEARVLFEAQAKANANDGDAWLGLALVAHRKGELPLARSLYERVLGLVPDYADAMQGLAAVAKREGKESEAKTLLEKALKLQPTRADIREDLEALTGLPPESEITPVVRPQVIQMPARVQGRAFELPDGKGGWQPVFLKGMNLGAALPGRHPSEFPDKATYVGWLRELGELGVNSLRVYTIHPPHFYQALLEYNRTAKRPLWLIHGVWTELPPEHDFEERTFKAAWEREMSDVVDVIHGRGRISRSPGKSSGGFTADVSPWTLAIILGREWESSSVVAFNRRHPGQADWKGRFVAVTGGHAMERWLAQAMDAFLGLEWDRYHAQRPIAFTNWPTLDPLHHITESTEVEEEALRSKLGIPEEGLSDEPNDEDAVALDMQKFDALPACQAGLFASYHAYPYYPDFMNLEPSYNRATDHLGRNNYFGYLKDLVQHHTKHPVVIAEFGVPSSRMVAHWQAQGLTHGGQNEREQGEQDARMIRNMHDAGCAGGMLFAWIDEWFKKNWLALPFMRPLERVPLWYNVGDAEENYGLIAYHPGKGGPTILIDGKAQDWAQVPTYLEGKGYRLQLKADEGWLHLGITTPAPLDFAHEALLVGIDTIDPLRGSTRLPWGLEPKSAAGLEFVVALQGEGRTGVYVDAPYLLPEHRWNPRHLYRSLANDEGNFVMPTAKSNMARVGRDGTRFPPHSTEVGWLRQGTADPRDPAYNDRSEWQVGRLPDGRGFIEARLPWGLLNVADPSSRRVIDDPATKKRSPLGISITPGFHLVLLALDTSEALSVGGATVKLTLPALKGKTLPMGPLFSWPGWEQPTFHRYRKLSFGLYQKALEALPGTPRSLP